MNTTIKPLDIDEITSLIRYGVPVVFETMLKLNAYHLPDGDFPHPGKEIVVGSVGFIGEATGMVYTHVTVDLARKLASQMLGFPIAELDDDMVNDVIGELSNMTVGSVKSMLCDSGAPCTLTIPSIIRDMNFCVNKVGPEERRSLYFTCGEDRFLILVLMKPPTN